MRYKNIMDGIVVLVGILVLLFLFVAKMFTETNILIPAIIVTIIFILLIAIYKFVNNKMLKNVDLDYIRDIPNKYDLPTVAFLYNNNVKIDPLIAALKLKLKRLNIIDNEEKIISNNGIEKLSDTEKYLLNLLYFNNEEKYSVVGFNEVLHEQLRNMNFSDGAYKGQLVVLSGIIFLIGGGIISILTMNKVIKFETYDSFLVSLFMLALVSVPISLFLPSILQYTKEAKKERKNIVSFYNFLKDFTSLNEKEMSEYPLWREYLEFAVLFKINTKYTIENVNLITTDEFFDRLEELGKDEF